MKTDFQLADILDGRLGDLLNMRFDIVASLNLRFYGEALVASLSGNTRFLEFLLKDGDEKIDLAFRELVKLRLQIRWRKIDPEFLHAFIANSRDTGIINGERLFVAARAMEVLDQ